MASESESPRQLHFVVFPLMSPGHMLPMIDLATTLARHNHLVTVVTTTQNATRLTQTFARATHSGLPLRLAQLEFPSKDAGFPEGCENFDMLPSMGMAWSFFNAASVFLQEPAEKLFDELSPRPNCIISDVGLPYTCHIAKKFNVPRISFFGVSCFCLLWPQIIMTSKILDVVATDSDCFPIPGIPHEIEIKRSHIPGAGQPSEVEKEFVQKMVAAEMSTYGVVVNSFEELEPPYAADFKKLRNDKVWCVGPLSLRNKDQLDKAQRGNKASIDEQHCMEWLDSQQNGSVIYVCLGSMCNLIPLQLIELGMALEECNWPFIWVLRERNQTEELKNWIQESGFEDRTKGHGLIIRGWAPQVLILSHPAIGGFLTHCGWNSTLEAICAGVPMLTWPLFGDQFFNERFVVQIQRVGVTVGVDIPVNWGHEEETGVLVKKEDVLRAIEELMGETNEGEERRKRVKELAEMAARAVEEEGSSHFNVTTLIQDIMEHTN